MAADKKLIAVVTFLGRTLFFEDDEDEDESNERAEIVKISHYVERVVSNMNDETFRQHFRLKRLTLSKLLEKLGPQLVEKIGNFHFQHVLFIMLKER